MKVLSKYVIKFENNTWINIFIIVRKKSDANMHVFLYNIGFILISFWLRLKKILKQVDLPSFVAVF